MERGASKQTIRGGETGAWRLRWRRRGEEGGEPGRWMTQPPAERPSQTPVYDFSVLL